MAFRNLSTSSIFTGVKTSKLWDQTTFPGTFESIQTVIATATMTSISFTNIPQNYRHLQIRGIGRRSGLSGANGGSLAVRLNSASSGYNFHNLRGDGSSVTSAAATYFSEIAAQNQYSSASQLTNVFSAFIIDLLNYSSSDTNKTIRIFGGFDNNGAGGIGLNSGFLQSTSPITSITIFDDFVARSSFALYGIRGA